MNLELYSKKLDSDGVVVIPNVFSSNLLKLFESAALERFADVKNIVQNSNPQIREYITAFDKIYYNKKKYYNDLNNEKIIELAKGRYDYSLNTSEGIFATEEFLNPEPIHSLMEMKLKTQYSQHAGVVPAIPNSDNGPWHRDIYPFFDKGEGSEDNYDDSIEVKLMPPFYYTLLIPLENINVQNGSTEFILSSHKKSFNECVDLPKFQTEVQAGSVLLFDGRIFHRGRENKSIDPRMVIYKVYHKNWYNDY
ncbi:phytanoyl-CoA dioxygenase family protein [Pigmentibacter sp. JX0631]|uniref:phytanoyl-CoA dioxygenase family protein n=1 Tax=Pigmentibacter sp. JX0631 TaxID=2976982 RepID=UPI0024691400|nr:phytanoyl-CoA dioxygenase family protein [Pigmentibacter sp. JX0631]WGL59110.1 phytanoyl-CoA dioxygenase family protein [Pigmentibacter sp. JX0631]